MAHSGELPGIRKAEWWLRRAAGAARARRIDGPLQYRDTELLRTFLSDRGVRA